MSRPQNLVSENSPLGPKKSFEEFNAYYLILSFAPIMVSLLFNAFPTFLCTFSVVIIFQVFHSFP